MKAHPSRFALWWARLAIALVFVANVQCAILFLIAPESYLRSFELSGVAGTVAIQGIAVAFLMWNATYPLAIINPYRFRTVFGIVLAQQVIGLIGEIYILAGIGAGHEMLSGSISRFIAFDALGLVLMAAGAIGLSVSASRHKMAAKTP